MIKGRYLLFVLLSCCLLLPARGQKQKKLNKIIQQNRTLEDNIKKLKDDSVTVWDNVKKTLKQIDNDSLEYKKLMGEYTRLKNSISKDTIAVLKAAVTKLEEQLKAQQEALAKTEGSIGKIRQQIAGADSVVKSLAFYNNIKSQQLMEKDRAYLDQRYEQMQMAKLQEMLKKSSAYRSQPGFADYLNRLQTAIRRKGLYDRAWNCLETGTDYQQSQDIRVALQPLLKARPDGQQQGGQMMTMAQFDEIDSLDIRLSRYNSGIIHLKDVVTTINTDREVIKMRKEHSATQISDCVRRIRELIIPMEGSERQEIYQRYFDMIPYLKKLLNDYWEELKKNPFGTPTETENIIMDLVEQQ